MFSDNEDGGYKPPKKPKPDNTPDNQLLLISEFDDLVNRDYKKLDKSKNMKYEFYNLR